MSVLRLMYEYWLVSIIMAFPVFFILDAIQSNVFKILIGIRPLRTINILFRGWPPEHLDADGDFKTKDTNG